MYFTCLEKVSLGSSERPRILGNGSVVRILLLMDILRDLEYSAGSGVKRVDWVLFVLMMRLFWVTQFVIVFRYGCNSVYAVL